MHVDDDPRMRTVYFPRFNPSAEPMNPQGMGLNRAGAWMRITIIVLAILSIVVGSQAPAMGLAIFAVALVLFVRMLYRPMDDYFTNRDREFVTILVLILVAGVAISFIF